MGTIVHFHDILGECENQGIANLPCNTNNISTQLAHSQTDVAVCKTCSIFLLT